MFDRILRLLLGTEHRRRRAIHSTSAEHLEPRQLLTLVAGETQVQFTTGGDQINPAISSAPDGRTVVVWSGPGVTNSSDIYAQRFDANGAKVGSEIKVVSSANRETSPDVAVDGNGNFIVTWVDLVNTTTGNRDVKAQRFSNTGAKLGNVVLVANSSAKEFEPSIACDAAGNFLVAWTVENSTSGDRGVLVRRFRNDGVPLAAASTVENSSLKNEHHPDVTRAPDGRFAICYETGADGDVILKRYTATGSLVARHTIASGTLLQVEPRVSMDSQANVMVVWQEVFDKSRIRAKRVSNAGVVSSTINVTPATGFFARPDISMKRDGSAFVVTYFDPTALSSHMVEMTMTGTPLYRVTLVSSSAGVRPTFTRTAVAFGSGANYRIAYEKFPNNSTGVNVYLRRGRLS